MPGPSLAARAAPCEIVGSHWHQAQMNADVMVPSLGSARGHVVTRVTLALMEDSGWYKADYGMAGRRLPEAHWGYQDGCPIADPLACWTSSNQDLLKHGNEFCDPALSSGHSDYAHCDPRHRAVVACTADTGLPAACAQRLVEYYDHHCGDATRFQTLPYSDVNFQLELAGDTPTLRGTCLMSDLRAPRKFEGKQYLPNSDDFSAQQPRCYRTRCADDGLSYTVVGDDARDDGGDAVTLGTCTTAGQLLEGGAEGSEGAIRCANPHILCGVGLTGAAVQLEEGAMPPHWQTQVPISEDPHMPHAHAVRGKYPGGNNKDGKLNNSSNRIAAASAGVIAMLLAM